MGESELGGNDVDAYIDIGAFDDVYYLGEVGDADCAI